MKTIFKIVVLFLVFFSVPSFAQKVLSKPSYTTGKFTDPISIRIKPGNYGGKLPSTSVSIKPTSTDVFSAKIVPSADNTQPVPSIMSNTKVDVFSSNQNLKFEKLAPNPTSGIVNLFLNFKPEAKYNATVYNTSGNVVLQTVVNINNAVLDLSHVMDGEYFVRITNTSDNSIFSQKVIVSH